MRWGLGRFIPVVMFAVLVQLLAPVGATWALAAAVSDPLAAAPICSGVSDAYADDTSSGSQPVSHSVCCPLCMLAYAGSAALAAPDAPFVALQRSYRNVVWLAVHLAPRSNHDAGYAQARAPPPYS